MTIFDYIDKIVSATTSGISIISFTSVIGTSVGIVSASFTLIFSLPTGIIISFTSVVGGPVGIESAGFTLIFSLTIGIVKIIKYNKKQEKT